MSDALTKAIHKALTDKGVRDLEHWGISETLQNYGYNAYFPLETELGTVTIEESVLGGEDMGITDVHFILKVTGGTTYYKLSGTYDSWDGGEWEDKFKQVVPTPVERIEYLEVK